MVQIECAGRQGLGHAQSTHAGSPGTRPWHLWAGSRSSRESPWEGGCGHRQPPTAACESQAWGRGALLLQRGKMGWGWSSRSLAELPEVPGTKQLLGSQREGVWPPTSPTCPSSRPLGPASVHLSLQYFLELPGLCLCCFLCLLCPFPNFLSSSLISLP